MIAQRRKDAKVSVLCALASLRVHFWSRERERERVTNVDTLQARLTRIAWSPGAMRVEKVLTNLSCNQNCRYCTSRAPSDDLRFVARAQVLARIDKARARGAEEIVLTGGEPM